jgi:hypothetical protein
MIGHKLAHYEVTGHLFFEAADGKLNVVAVNTSGNAFNPGSPQPLFDMNMAQTENGTQFEYDVTADGKRWLGDGD